MASDGLLSFALQAVLKELDKHKSDPLVGFKVRLADLHLVSLLKYCCMSAWQRSFWAHDMALWPQAFASQHVSRPAPAL